MTVYEKNMKVKTTYGDGIIIDADTMTSPVITYTVILT